MARYIEFVELDRRERKTKSWQVVAKENRDPIGIVTWYPRWRKYSFAPLPETIYEETCLRDLADFCGSQTRLQRLSWANKPVAAGQRARG